MKMRRFAVRFVNMKPSLFPSRKTAVPEMRRSLSDSSEHEEAERPTHPLRKELKVVKMWSPKRFQTQ